MNSVRHQDTVLQRLGSHSKTSRSDKKKLQRDLTPLQLALYRAITRNRDAIVETAGDENRHANLLLPALLRAQKPQTGIRAMIVTSDPADVKAISGHFDRIAGGADRIRVVQLGSVDSARTEATRISNDPEVIISTPERMIDHIRRDHLDLSHIRISVIDEPEADKAPGFNADLEYIYTKLPHRPQTCVFVETMHEETSVVAALLKRPVLLDRSALDRLAAAERQADRSSMSTDTPERSEPKRRKERRSMKEKKAPKEDRLDDEGIKKALKTIVYEIHHNEEPRELNWLRKHLRKHVSLFNRGYVAAYLLREYMTDRPSSQRTKKDGEEAATIFVGVGKNRHVYPKDLIELFTDVNGLSKDDIGQIKILDNYSFVELNPAKAKDAIDSLNGKDYRGRKLNVNFARKKE